MPGGVEHDPHVVLGLERRHGRAELDRMLDRGLEVGRPRPPGAAASPGRPGSGGQTGARRRRPSARRARPRPRRSRASRPTPSRSRSAGRGSPTRTPAAHGDRAPRARCPTSPCAPSGRSGTVVVASAHQSSSSRRPALAPPQPGRTQPHDQLARGDRHRAGGDHVVVPLGRYVVVVAVETALGDAEPAREHVELVVRRVAGEVGPEPAVAGGRWAGRSGSSGLVRASSDQRPPRADVGGVDVGLRRAARAAPGRRGGAGGRPPSAATAPARPRARRRASAAARSRGSTDASRSSYPTAMPCGEPADRTATSRGRLAQPAPRAARVERGVDGAGEGPRAPSGAGRQQHRAGLGVDLEVGVEEAERDPGGAARRGSPPPARPAARTRHRWSTTSR